MTDFALQASHLSKHYDDGENRIDVLVDVSVAIARGEMVAVVGASGSGKSTLLHALGLLDLPSSRNCKIINVIELDEKDLLQFCTEYCHAGILRSTVDEKLMSTGFWN